MTTKARAKTARKPATKKTLKSPEVVQAQKLPEPVPEIRFNPLLCIVRAADQEPWSVLLGDGLKKQFTDAGLDGIVGEEVASKHNGPVILVRGDAAIDQRLIPVLLKRPNFLLLSDDPGNPTPVAANVRGRDVARTVEILRGAKAFTGEELLARAPSQLEVDARTSPRERQAPFARIVTPGNRGEIELLQFQETQGLATNVPTSYATRLLARLGVRPDIVGIAIAALAVAALWFFFKSQFALGPGP